MTLLEVEKTMLNISGLQEGVVLDHIQAGKSLDIYYHLWLDRLTDCQVAHHQERAKQQDGPQGHHQG